IPGLVVAYAKKRPLFPAERFCEAANSLIHCDKVRIAGADHPLRIDKAIHINRDPAAVQKYEVLVPNQPDMVRTISLDKELFRVSSKAEHFAMTRLELLLVHRRRLSCASHVGLARASARARAGAHPGFMSVYVWSVTLHVRLSTDGCSGFRSYLRFVLLHRRVHLLRFRWRSSLRFLRLVLRLLRLRCLA